MGYIVVETSEYATKGRGGSPARGVAGYRTKEVRYGDNLDVEIYPYWRRRPDGIRSRKLKESRAAQKNQNAKDAKKLFVRTLMHNFAEGDLHVSCTFAGEKPDEQKALKEAQIFIRKWQAERKKAGLEKGKWMRVIEGAAEGSKRVHLHFVLEKGLSRDVIEGLWKNGYCNADRIRVIDGSIRAIAEYLAKDPKGKKRWGASRGLKKPEITIHDRKVTARKAREMEVSYDSCLEQIRRLYPDHGPVRVEEPRYSDYVTGAYFYIELKRKGGCDEKNSLPGLRHSGLCAVG